MPAYVITLAPDKALEEKMKGLKKQADSLSKNHLYLEDDPHVTLFIIKTNKSLDKDLERIVSGFSPVKIEITDWIVFNDTKITGKIALACAFNPASFAKLREVQDKIANLSVRRSGKLKRYLNSTLFKENIDKFGYPFIGEVWIPHISVGSFSAEEFETLKKKLKCPKGSYTLNSINLYELDEERDKMTFLKSFPPGKPLIIRHRVNSIKELEKVDPKYGVEIDIRHSQSGFYLNHNPGRGDKLADYLKTFVRQGNRFIIFNIKEAGIEEEVIEMADKLGIKNYFLLDTEFPFIYRACEGELAEKLDGRLAVRYSEAEPLEQAMALKGKFKWVWVDTNTRLPLDNKIYKQLKDAGYKLALVCPERWGRPGDIQKYINQMKKEGIMIDTVMTGEAHVDQWENSGVVGNG